MSGLGYGAIAEQTWGDASTQAPVFPEPPATNAAAIWAHELLPGVSAGEMLIAIYEHLIEVEPGYSAARMLRIIAAAVAGKTTGGPGGFVARNVSDSADQITGAADESGNRSSASYGP